ncbi:unnamed protein product [Eruca vesicaria subsp. sativa]|uniref:Prolamin-like domain-containing protein n=1 Tax=Eruca vesicaria subsp. sativa TaxID=29727 RepID=A0ABC8KTT6_ERUVS|nr:unnamed protein product [Eruca vesicaria subsp. sativa]
MENKAVVMWFLLITTLISSTYPSLAIEYEDKPLLDPNTSLQEAFEWSPGSRVPFSSEPTRDAENFNMFCTKTRDVKCDDEMFLDLYKIKPMSKQCCLIILHNGVHCNMLYAKIRYRMYQRRRSVSKSFLFRAKKLLNRCSAVIGTPTPLSG